MMQAQEHGLHGILHSARLVEEEMRRRLAPLGIHPRQAQALTAIHHMQPVSQVDLAKEFDITSASMSTLTDRLLAAGFITRKTDPVARRRNVLELTDEGRAKLNAIFESWEAVDRTIRDAMGTQDAQELFRLTARLRDNLGGRVPGRTRD